MSKGKDIWLPQLINMGCEVDEGQIEYPNDIPSIIEIYTSGSNLSIVSDSLKNSKFWTDKWFWKEDIETEIWFDETFIYGGGYEGIYEIDYRDLNVEPNKKLLRQNETTICLWDNILSIREISYVLK